MKFYSNPRWWLALVPFMVLFSMEAVILGVMFALDLAASFAEFLFNKTEKASSFLNAKMTEVNAYVWEKK